MKQSPNDVVFKLSCTRKQRSLIAAFRKKYNERHGTTYSQSEIMLLAFSDFMKRSKIHLELVQPELFENAL